jgi:HJR/Mrr/RecB family endonuclease
MSGLADFVGQTAIKELIRPKIQIAQTTGTTLPHLLLCGGREQGKVTLATAIADEMGTPFSSASAESLPRILDLTAVLSTVQRGQVVAISDVELLEAKVLDCLAAAISTYQVGIRVGAGQGFRTHSLPMPSFAFVGTSSKRWLVDERIRRWCIACEFAPYSQEEVARIVQVIAGKKGLHIDEDAAHEIAAASKLNRGAAEVFLQKVANHFAFKSSLRIDRSVLVGLHEFLGSGSFYPNVVTLTDQIRQMEGVEFEHWVADLFKRSGFQVETTPRSGDHGVDLFAASGNHVIAVQCKRWDGTVGEPVLRDLYGAMMSANAKAGCLVTTGSFTVQAQAFAKDKPLSLMGWDLLMEAAKSPATLMRLLRIGS